MTLKVSSSSCSPILKRIGRFSSDIVPDSSLRPSITSTAMGKSFFRVGILLIYPSCRSMKQEDAPESMSVEGTVFHHPFNQIREMVVKMRATGGEEMSLLVMKFWSNDSPPTVAGPISFPAEQASYDNP